MNNWLLTSLPPRDLDILRPHLSRVELPPRSTVQVQGEACHHAYFIQSGVVSLVAGAGRERLDVGLVGREGLLGLCVLLGHPETLLEAVVQIPGTADRIGASELEACMEASPALASALRRYAHVSICQISQTALANGRCTVEQRLARWLLMADDRLSGTDIALTHEFLAVVLGVRRPGVTVALHVLEGVHAIRSRRNLITILDRDRLKAIAGPSYGPAEALYRSTFGVGLAPA